jgi:divalent metal cation (Fe/Co/Zn/Cd) transporter
MLYGGVRAAFRPTIVAGVLAPSGLVVEQTWVVRQTGLTDKVLASPEARGLHDLRIRPSGDHTLVEFHLEVASHLTIAQGTPSAMPLRAAENAIAQLFLPSIVAVTAHLEPTGINDERLDDRVASAQIP